MRNSYQFPVEVTVGVDPAIGGPSAGLMFSLGIYDTLTEGSMTGGEVVAGTGTIGPDGAVGPIGGIDQKIAGAARRRCRASSWCRPTTATTPTSLPTATCAWSGSPR